jgi:hypothetical protein
MSRYSRLVTLAVWIATVSGFKPMPPSTVSHTVRKSRANTTKLHVVTTEEVYNKPLAVTRKNWILASAVDRHMAAHKQMGIDKDHGLEYWFDQRIHSLGNRGFMGGVHAATAMVATKLIDMAAYGGTNLRTRVRIGHCGTFRRADTGLTFWFFIHSLQVAVELATIIGNSKARVVDLCCGVGTSTRSIAEAFPDAESIIGGT